MENFAEFRKMVVKPQINYTSPWYARTVIRKFSPYITWFLVKFTSISANQVTLMQFIVSLIGLAFLCNASLFVSLCGIALLHLGYIFDVVDGEVARYRKKTTLSGMFLDFVNHEAIMPMTYGCLSFHYFFTTSSVLYFYIGLGIILTCFKPVGRARQTTINYLITKRRAPSYDVKNYVIDKDNNQQESFNNKVSKKNLLKKIKHILPDILDYPNDIIIIAGVLLLEIISGNNYIGKMFIVIYFFYSSVMFMVSLWWHMNNKVIEKSFMAHIQGCLELVRENPGLFEDKDKDKEY